jgi:hypothetical protein
LLWVVHFNGLKMWWCHHLCMLVLNLARLAPGGCHVSTTRLPRQRHDIHVSTTWHQRQRHVAANSSLQVSWRVNPWRSLSSQILGFGLGSLGFTPIYDSLKTSWIMTIHDETVNTSRVVICDAQSMTKWNFVIDALLWRKLDDPWWKSTVIDRKVFCSVMRVWHDKWNAFLKQNIAQECSALANIIQHLLV